MEVLWKHIWDRIWHSWQTWAIIAVHAFVILSLILLALYGQQLLTQHAMDRSSLKSVEVIGHRQDEILKAIAEMKTHRQKTDETLGQLKATVEEAKETNKERKP